MPQRYVNIVTITALILISLSIFTNSMTKPLGHDEHMYCTAGYFLANGKLIYRDFSYVAQLPYHPLLCAAVFKVFNTTYYLLTARLLSVLCDILIVICIVGIYRHIFKPFVISGTIMGLSACILLISNELVDYAIGFAWNHSMVVLCVVLSFWLFITIDFSKKNSHCKVGLIGALLTIATWTRPTALLVLILFVFMLLIQPVSSIKKRCKIIIPFLISACVFSIWPIWIIIKAPGSFMLNVFKIPTLNSQFLHEIGMVYNKISLTISSISTPGYFLLIVTAISLTVLLIYQRRNLHITNGKNAILSLLLVVVFVVTVYIPPTMWLQYLAIPVPFICISFAYPMLYLRKINPDKNRYNKSFVTAFCIIACASIASIALNQQTIKRNLYLFSPDEWIPLKIHSISEEIHKSTKNPPKILTLSPLYAIEGGSEIYSELSAGPFAYRVANRLSKAQRLEANIVGADDVDELIEKSLPSVIIVGTEPFFLEEPLVKIANSQNWEKRVYADYPIVVYFNRRNKKY